MRALNLAANRGEPDMYRWQPLSLFLVSISFTGMAAAGPNSIGPEVGTKVEIFDTTDIRGRFCDDTFA